MPLKSLVSHKLLDSAFIFLQGLYLIRYPLLVFFVIAAFMPVTLYFWLSTLMANLYDLEGFLKPFWFSLSAFLLSFSAATTLKLILLYGGERIEFDAETRRRLSSKANKFALGRFFFVISLVLTGILISGVFLFDSGGTGMKVLGVIAGFGGAMFLLLLADVLQRLINRTSNAESLDRFLFPFRNPLAKWANRSDILYRFSNYIFRPSILEPYFQKTPGYLGLGYMRYKEGGIVETDEDGRASFNPGHFTAVALLFFFSLIYAVIGWSSYVYPAVTRETLGVTAISYLMVLLTVLVWTLGALSFFLDRYRFPVLLVIIPIYLLASVTSHDYVFSVMDLSANQASPVQFEKLTPAEVLDRTPVLVEAPEEDYVIVVAANGGGIQAGAWAAKVLTGIEEQCRKPEEFGANFQGCAPKIRLISSVSGGSVGAMYFVNSYRPPGVERPSYDEVVRKSSDSSLDAVAWGLVYPDFSRSVLPFYPFKPGRGQALEDRWASDEEDRLTDGLYGWREGVRAGWRPATIFNATIVESGERMLLATTDICENKKLNGLSRDDDDECIQRGNLVRQSQPSLRVPEVRAGPGRTNFYSFFEGRDIPIVTAVRLSASFPYVTPAPRADIEPCKEGECVHIVDGGYYDNYGMSSLMEWLNEALSYRTNRKLKHVLIVQIRGDQVGVGAARADSSSRPYYQSVAPLLTLLNVRNTGQLSHNETELEVFRRYWASEGVNIETAIFEYKNKDDKPPLSWHLSEKQKRNINEAWGDILQGKGDHAGWTTMRNFIKSRLEKRVPAPSNYQ